MNGITTGAYSVGRVAALAGVTIRALHHYDEIGLLSQQITRLQAMAEAITREMEARRMGLMLTPEERLEVFGDFHLQDHAAEAEQRWGDTDAWRQSRQRASRCTKQDWLAIRDEMRQINRGVADAKADGVAADGAAAPDQRRPMRYRTSHTR